MVRRIYKKPHRAKRKKPFFAKAAFWRVSGSAVFAGAAIWLICFSPMLEVKEISVSGTEKINGQDCVKLIEEQVNKKIAFIGSKSILLFNLDRAKKDLLAQFPQIEDIKIKIEYPSKIYASVQERRGVAFFKDTTGKSYLIDNEGIAFEEASGQNDLLEIADSHEQTIVLGSSPFSKELLLSILKIKADIASFTDIAIKSAFITSPERINLQTADGWYIYFNPLKDTSDQLVKLEAVINDESFKQKRNNLEYVDIRFTRVYLKEKQALQPPQEIEK